MNLLIPYREIIEILLEMDKQGYTCFVQVYATDIGRLGRAHKVYMFLLIINGGFDLAV